MRITLTKVRRLSTVKLFQLITLLALVVMLLVIIHLVLEIMLLEPVVETTMTTSGIIKDSTIPMATRIQLILISIKKIQIKLRLLILIMERYLVIIGETLAPASPIIIIQIIKLADSFISLKINPIQVVLGILHLHLIAQETIQGQTLEGSIGEAEA